MPDWIGQTALNWLESTGVDIARYAVFAVGVWLVLWVLLRNLMRPRKIREATPPARQLVVEFLISLRSIAVFSTVGLIMFGLEGAGLLPGPAMAAGWGGWWFAASLVLMIVAHDAYFYWTHRLIHDRRLFRWFHRRHHRSNNPSPFTAYSFDLSEAAVNALFVPLWMIVVPTGWEVLGLFMLHQIARNTIGHCGYEIMPARRDGKPLFDWITTPTHHDIHHAEAGWNYGLYFTWWDRLMGTEHPEYHARYAAAAKLSAPSAPAVVKAAAMVVALCAIALPPPSEAQAANSVAGDWATLGVGAVVRLGPCESGATELCGTLVWVWDPATVKPGRLNKTLLSGFVLRDGRWRDGTLHNPADGNVYSGEIWLDGAVLRLKGCSWIFCDEQAWRRVSDLPQLQRMDAAN